MAARPDPAEDVVLTRDLGDLNRLRIWLRERLSGLGVDVDEVVVMATELVTNVIRHTTSAPRVRLSIGSDRLRIVVFDDATEVPILQPLDPSRPGGNGLRIVDTWSDSWGTEATAEGGKAVWFTVPTGR